MPGAMHNEEAAKVAYLAWVCWVGFPHKQPFWEDLTRDDQGRWDYVAWVTAGYQKTGKVSL